MINGPSEDVEIFQSIPKQSKEVIDLQREVLALEAEIDRRRYLVHPDEWVKEGLKEFVWSKQIEICRSVAIHRRTAVPSCYGSGKSWLAARLACWWISCHPPGEAFVVTSAPTNPQVRAILWREMHRAHSAGDLRGRMNQTEWWYPNKHGKHELVAFGRKPDDLDTTAFQGIHAAFVLVVLDEAAGIPYNLYEAADALITNEDSRVLAIGNPEDAASEFGDICKPTSGWNVIRIPVWCTPNFTGEEVPAQLLKELVSKVWVKEKEDKWGRDDPRWFAKVEAQFPESNESGLIPPHWIEKAQNADLGEGNPVLLGVDVGGGGDKSVIALRRGKHVRIIKRSGQPDTMQTCGMIMDLMEKTGAAYAQIDEIGIGRGIVDRGKELGANFIGVNVGQHASKVKKKAENPSGTNPFYINFRAEAYWELRTRFQDGEIDIDSQDSELQSQLIDLRFKRLSTGRIQMESKDEMKRRGRHSPDDAEAVMLAFADPPKPIVQTTATWGR